MPDRDGYTSDWIELHNPNDVPVDVTGYRLVDDAKRPFVLPATTMAARGYLVVYASGKDRAVAGAPLHAGFRLSRGGEKVRLLSPAGDLIDELAFGKQPADVSVGRPQPVTRGDWLPGDAVVRYATPGDELAKDWMQPGFDDGSWSLAQGGVGFVVGNAASLPGLIGTDIAAAVRGKKAALLARWSFDRGDDANQLFLHLHAIGGFVVYLNGVEVARHRAPETLDAKSRAIKVYESRDVRRALAFDLTAQLARLQPRGNVLAVHALLDHRHVNRFVLRPRIAASRASGVLADRAVAFAEPSPGRANGAGVARVPAMPRIEPHGAVFAQSVEVEVEAPRDTEVRYTLDGSEPTVDSPRTSGSITIDANCQLRVRAFANGQGGATTIAQFARMADDVQLSSNLPIVIVATGKRDVAIKAWTDAQIHVVEPADDGRANLRAEPALASAGAIKIRGSSTLPLPKKGYGLEFRGRKGRDKARRFVGMPKGSDWVLYAPHHWDQSHLRNALCYELARRVGLNAPRTRFVELFVCDDERAVSMDHYRGLYLVVERIAIDKQRIAIDELSPADRQEPAITGGYVFKVDRLGPGEKGFEAGGRKLQFVAPKEREITDPQRQWLQQHLDAFGGGLKDEAFRDPVRGYEAFLDVDSVIDYHLFQEWTNNPDAFTLSTYFYKPRGGRIHAGPVWDCDRTLRTNDSHYWLGRPGEPYGWTRDTHAGWFGYLFRDPEWRRRYRARGRELLQDALSVAAAQQLVDALANEITEAEQRDRKRWPILPAGYWENEILRLKEYIRKRGQWMAAELLEAPKFTRIGEGKQFELHLAHGNSAGTIYYTTNGADPVLDSLEVSPHAKAYEGPIPVTGDIRVYARVKVGSLWSRRVDHLQFDPPPQLMISEIMYNPTGGRDYEFLELRNFGTTPIDLRPLEIRGTVQFAFSMGSIHTLEPGARCVVVQDLPHFERRYDTAKIPVAGAYYGNCNNTEGDIVVVGAVGQQIATAHYVDDWLPPTDGKGFSMVPVRDANVLRNKGDWQRNPKKYGTPGF